MLSLYVRNGFQSSNRWLLHDAGQRCLSQSCTKAPCGLAGMMEDDVGKDQEQSLLGNNPPFQEGQGGGAAKETLRSG